MFALTNERKSPFSPVCSPLRSGKKLKIFHAAAIKKVIFNDQFRKWQVRHNKLQSKHDEQTFNNKNKKKVGKRSAAHFYGLLNNREPSMHDNEVSFILCYKQHGGLHCSLQKQILLLRFHALVASSCFEF